MGPAVRSACCRWAASTTRSGSRSGPKVTLCTYADLMRVPASRGVEPDEGQGGGRRYPHGLFDARRHRASPRRSRIARSSSSRSASRRRRRRPRSPFVSRRRSGSTNFSIFCNHVLTPPAMQAILEASDADAVEIDGFVGPSHVSTVIGMTPYQRFATEFHKPVVVAGFEPLDVMQAIVMLVRQVNEGRREVENQYRPRGDGGGQSQGAGRGRGDVRTARELRMARARRDSRTAPCACARLMRQFDAERRFRSSRGRRATIPPANAARSCAAPSGRMTASYSARSARRRRRWAPAWCRRKAPAPRIGPIGAFATARREGSRREHNTSRSPQARPATTAASISRMARAGARWRSSSPRFSTRRSTMTGCAPAMISPSSTLPTGAWR